MVTINRVYTRKGDAGETSLIGGQAVFKDDPRVRSYGAVDELNAALVECIQDAALVRCKTRLPVAPLEGPGRDHELTIGKL